MLLHHKLRFLPSTFLYCNLCLLLPEFINDFTFFYHNGGIQCSSNLFDGHNICSRSIMKPAHRLCFHTVNSWDTVERFIPVLRSNKDHIPTPHSLANERDMWSELKLSVHWYFDSFLWEIYYFNSSVTSLC